MLKSKTEIGMAIRKYRTEQKLTQTEFAELLNVSKSAVSNWENGETYTDLEVLEKLATMMKITLDDLIREKDVPSKLRVFDAVNFGALMIQFHELTVKPRTTLRLKAKNNTDKPLNLKSLHYQLTDPEGRVLKETTKIIPSYDEWDDDIRTTEKLSNIPSFISSNDEIILEFIYDTSLHRNVGTYVFTLIFNNHEVKLEISPSIIEFLDNQKRMIRSPDKLNEDVFQEILQYILATGNLEEAISFFLKRKELLDLDDLKTLGIAEMDQYCNKLSQNLTEETKYQLLEDHFPSSRLLVDLKDADRLNKIFDAHESQILSLLQKEPTQAKVLYYHLYPLLTSDHKARFAKLFAQVEYEHRGTEGLSLFDAYVHHFVNDGTYSSTYEAIKTHGKRVSSRQLRSMIADLSDSQILDLIHEKDVQITLSDALRMIQERMFKKESNQELQMILLEYVEFNDKEHFLQSKNLIHSKELLELLIQSGKVSYDYLL